MEVLVNCSWPTIGIAGTPRNVVSAWVCAENTAVYLPPSVSSPVQFCVDDPPGVKYPAGDDRNSVFGSVGSKVLSPLPLPPPQALNVRIKKEQIKT